MPRKMRCPKRRASEVSAAIVSYLETGAIPDGHGVGIWECIDKSAPDDGRLYADWLAVRKPLVAKWTADHPGRRPWFWWLAEAPHEAIDNLAPDRIWRPKDRLAAHRRRVGGVGWERYRALGGIVAFEFGLPTEWITPWQWHYYNGRLANVHGEPIGTEFDGHTFEAVPVDPDDLPQYESQASYLQRHGLFLPGEAARLTPADFVPETAVINLGPTCRMRS